MTKLLLKVISLLGMGWFLGVAHVTLVELKRKGFFTFLVHGKD